MSATSWLGFIYMVVFIVIVFGLAWLIRPLVLWFQQREQERDIEARLDIQEGYDRMVWDVYQRRQERKRQNGEW